MNRGFTWDKNSSLSETNTVSGVHVLIGKTLVDQFRKKNGKAARPSGLELEKVKLAGEAGIGMIRDLILNHGNRSYSIRTGV